MKQNIYDDEVFFKGYMNLRNAGQGLNQILDEPAVKAMLPELKGLEILDAGCGFGKNCAWYADQGARYVLGIDISVKMIDQAKKGNSREQIDYRVMALEDADFEAESFDLISSSLAIHYVQDYAALISNMYRWLKPGGRLVFSVEHPIATALPEQQWLKDDRVAWKYWPVNNYAKEGPRDTKWFVDKVLKYHRRVETYVSVLLENGFLLRGLTEPIPSAQWIEKKPELEQYIGRPAFLVISAEKGTPV